MCSSDLDVAWVMGSEAHGLSTAARERVDARVAIPMRGGAESLNLAAATAVCLFETLRLHSPE